MYSVKRCMKFVDLMTFAIASHRANGPQYGRQVGTWPAVDKVIECIEDAGLTVSDFIELDERPGAFDPHYRLNGWRTLLRQALDDPAVDLFDVLLP